MRTNCWAIAEQTSIKICRTFGSFLEIFHWACRKRTVNWRSLCKGVLWTVTFVPFGLETSDRSKPAKCFSPRRGTNNFFPFWCPVWPYKKHLINRARSVCMRKSWPRSLVQTSLPLLCTGDLGQDSPIQISRSVNKNSIVCSNIRNF